MVDKPSITITAFTPPPEIVRAVRGGRQGGAPGRRRGRVHDRRSRRQGALLRSQRAVQLRRQSGGDAWLRPAREPGRLPRRPRSAPRARRGAQHEVRLLGAGLRRLAAQRARRGDARRLAVHARPLCPRRADRLRPDLARRAEPQRHQGDGQARARCLVDGRGAGCGDHEARADGGGAPQLPPPGAVRQAGGQHRQHRGGRLSLNVVSSWWAEEARSYGLPFDQHDDRYGRTSEWLEVVDGLWTRARLDHSGRALPADRRHLRAEAGAQAAPGRSTPAANPRPPRR